MKSYSRILALFLVFSSLTLFAADDDVDSIEALTDKAPVSSVSSSAELVETKFAGNYIYPPANILVWNGKTTWAPGGRGIGEQITISFEQTISYDEIQIVNGFGGPNDLYNKNNRVKKIQISHIAGKNHFQNAEYDLADNKPDWQSIKFAQPQKAKTISFTINDVYRGNKYDDTCISGIRFVYQGKVLPYVGAETLLDAQVKASKAMLGKNTAQEFKDNYVGVGLVGPNGKDYFFAPDGQMYQGQFIAEESMFSPNGYGDESKYVVANNRINLKEVISYVQTTRSLIFIPDGKKGVTINGVYYKRVVPKSKIEIVY